MRAMSWWGKCALVGMGIIALLAFFAPFVAPYAPDMQDLDNILAPASAAHWCGSDYLGRDIFSRILYGARLSLGCAAVILVFIVILGISVGGLSGFVGGRIDALCMRICDIFYECANYRTFSLFGRCAWEWARKCDDCDYSHTLGVVCADCA